MTAATRTDRAERLIAASAERLFSCWTDPAMLTHWLPPRGMAGRVEVFDPTPGRPFRMVLSHEAPAEGAGGGEAVIAGLFVAVDPPRHLAFVSRFDSEDPGFQGEMRMDWHFDPVRSDPGGFDPMGRATRVRVIASGVPAGIPAEDHVDGMAASLTQLAALVE